MAIKPMVEPTLTEGSAGVTAIETKVGGGGGGCTAQVRTVLPLTLPMVAEMVDVPAETQVATRGSAAAPSVATEVVPLNQVACKVTSRFDPSE